MAEIVRGKKSNRVRVRKVRFKKDPLLASQGAKRPPVASPGTATKRYRQDPTARRGDTVTFCVSMPIEDLVRIDTACERLQMARSHFLRQASKHFAEWVFNGQQEKLWRAALSR